MKNNRSFKNNKSLSLLAILGGAMLAAMIAINSQLAAHTTAFQSSWLAHGIGALVALLLVGFPSTKNDAQKNNPDSAECVGQSGTNKISKIYYLGGIPGAFTVVLASITVQSSLGLAGTLALGLLGQLLLSLLAEKWGWFQLNKKSISWLELFPIFCVAIGSVLIIYGKS